MDLRRMTKKTLGHDKDMLFLGSKEELLKLIEDHSEDLQEPYFLIMKTETKELALYSYEGKLDFFKEKQVLFT